MAAVYLSFNKGLYTPSITQAVSRLGHILNDLSLALT